MARWTGKNFSNVGNSLRGLQVHPLAPAPLKEKIQRVLEKGNAVRGALMTGRARKRMLAYILEHGPRTTREVAHATRTSRDGLRRAMKDWMDSERPIRNAKKGPGTDIVEKLRRLHSRRRRDPTRLFSETQKARIVYHPATTRLIRRRIRTHIYPAYQEEAVHFVEKTLFTELDYTPSYRDLEWWVSTRVAYAIRRFWDQVKSKQRGLRALRRDLEQQLAEDLRMSPVEREVFRQLAEEEATRRAGKKEKEDA